MQIVIDVPEGKYKTITSYPKEWDEWTLNAIKNGTPLPKGHGRLIDADDRRTEIDEADRWVVDLASTIIEADKEGER